MQTARQDLTQLIKAIEPGFVKGGRVIYIGAGTSGRLGVLDASEAPPTFQVPPDRIIGIIAGGDPALRASSEGLEDDPDGAIDQLTTLKLTQNDAVIGIAAGGTTPFVLGALKHAASLSSTPVTALITCSNIAKPEGVGHLVVLPTGPEVLTGSTRMKAATATKLALNTISTTLMIRSGKVYENLMVDLRATNDKLTDRAGRIIMTLTGLGRAEALELLNHAQGQVKVAILMHKNNTGYDHAVQILSCCEGRLDRALDSTD